MNYTIELIDKITGVPVYTIGSHYDELAEALAAANHLNGRLKGFAPVVVRTKPSEVEQKLDLIIELLRSRRA